MKEISKRSSFNWWRLLINLLGLVLCIWTFANWGEAQALTPEIVVRKVQLGESYVDVVNSIGPGYTLGPLRKVRGSEGYYLQITRSGIGSLLFPQHNISIWFDATRRVAGGKATSVWRLDEEFHNFVLKPKQPDMTSRGPMRDLAKKPQQPSTSGGSPKR